MRSATAAIGRSYSGGLIQGLGPVVVLIAAPSPARAADFDLFDAQLVPILLAALILTIALGVLLMTTMRRHNAQRERELAVEFERARAELERVKQFLAAEAQIVVVWDRADAEPRVEGEFNLVSEAMNPRRILSFNGWLEPETAARVEEAVAKLLSRGEGFATTVASLKGRHLELAGRAISGNAVLRIRDVSGDRLERVRLQESFAEAEAALAGIRKALDALPHPAWTRGRDGKLTWRSAAFTRALESKDRKTPDASAELFDRTTLREAEEARAASGLWNARAHATVAGARRPFETFEVATDDGAVGFAIDLSESENLRAEKERQNGAYKSLLDRLATAVAIFDRGKRLDFYNAAYRQIWSLDPTFLDQRPTDGEILDHLRDRRLLPEQADFRAWKGADSIDLSGDGDGRERLASAGRARIAGRREPKRRGRRHLPLRRQHPELRARHASQRADPAARRDARCVEGGRRGVRRRRPAAAGQSRVRAHLGDAGAAAQRTPAFRRDFARLPAAVA